MLGKLFPAARETSRHPKGNSGGTRSLGIPTVTKLRSPVKWTYFYLYVILDVFSRYVVGWMAAPRESAELTKKLIQESVSKQGVPPGQLNIHADNGPSMTSQTLALKLADLGVTKSHSRPYVSDDNPFSESQFKTMKYRPEFPDRFGSLEDARVHSQAFFHWYNLEHHHSVTAMLTPHMVHYGLATGSPPMSSTTGNAS